MWRNQNVESILCFQINFNFRILRDKFWFFGVKKWPIETFLMCPLSSHSWIFFSFDAASMSFCRFKRLRILRSVFKLTDSRYFKWRNRNLRKFKETFRMLQLYLIEKKMWKKSKTYFQFMLSMWTGWDCIQTILKLCSLFLHRFNQTIAFYWCILLFTYECYTVFL